MLVLIVTKTTNYELHGASIEAKVEAGRIARDSLTRLLDAHTEHYQTLLALKAELAARAIAFDEVSREFPRPWSKAYDLVITVGGDGTLLAASHQMTAGGLLVGVRSSASSVGFLCAIGPKELATFADLMVKGQLPKLAVERVKAVVHRVDGGVSHETEPVLNDFLYANVSPAATTRYRLTVGGLSEVHRSSGMWLATATGSTAALYAAGGEQRPLTDKAFQYRVRELYRLGYENPTLAGGLFSPEDGPFRIENRCPAAILACDGQHGSLELAYGDCVDFVRAAPIDLVRPIAAVTGTMSTATKNL